MVLVEALLRRRAESMAVGCVTAGAIREHRAITARSSLLGALAIVARSGSVDDSTAGHLGARIDPSGDRFPSA
jgi:hypothetical protein